MSATRESILERQIVQLCGSITEFGFAAPVLIDDDNVLITGHARIEAAKRIGLREVPVLVASYWSKEQVKAYRLADNQLV